MSEYLDRKQVIELYEKHHSHLATYVWEFGQELRQLPIVEERPHGEWIEANSTDLKCSICGNRELKERTLVTFLNYCSLCGADMRKEGDLK